jgi:riboflavin synthase
MSCATLLRTTLGALEVGSSVNIERSARKTDEVGGHILSGHIDCVGEIVSLETPENNVLMKCSVPLQFSKYIFSKGYIAVDGASLTVNNADASNGTFEIWLIPETLRVTTFGASKVGDKLNVEIDRSTQVIVDTVERFLRENSTKN